MNYKVRTRAFGAIIAAALVFWLAETGYFGWNAYPQSAAEQTCDDIATAMFFSAWLVFFFPGLAFFRAVNPFRRVTWFYIERQDDGREAVTARSQTAQWRALLLAAVLWLLHKITRAAGAPSHLSRFLIVTRVVDRREGAASKTPGQD